MKIKIIVSAVISVLTASLLANSQVDTDIKNTNTSVPTYAVTGKLGKVYPDIAQALTQHVINWDQHTILGKYIEALGNKESAVDKALKEGVINEEQAKIVKFMFNDSAQLDLATANKMEDELVKSIGYIAKKGGYPIVDTNVTKFYGAKSQISEPKEGEPFYGQDASYQLTASSYTDNKDGTITDNVTGLIWESSPYKGKKFTWEQAMNGLNDFNTEKLGGYSDWRIPTLKELYSIVQFSGQMSMEPENMKPFFDEKYFKLMDLINPGDRVIDVQSITSTIYDSQTLGGTTTMFGYNFRDAFVKGYPSTKTFTVYHVRGNTHYGQNMFKDNQDGTISDEATGLMWMTADSGHFKVGDVSNGTLNWKDALSWCENLTFAGHSDWRLPNAKELQSIVDYHRSPDTTNSAAIDPLFQTTEIVNAAGIKDWGYYWTSTPFGDEQSIYISFGRAIGMMGDYVMDVHGAGAQRGDFRDGDRNTFPYHRGPQGDEMRTYNMVRAVRTIN
jgi:hypothetical protein